jgi:hypothetical protein
VGIHGGEFEFGFCVSLFGAGTAGLGGLSKFLLIDFGFMSLISGYRRKDCGGTCNDR